MNTYLISKHASYIFMIEVSKVYLNIFMNKYTYSFQNSQRLRHDIYYSIVTVQPNVSSISPN
jgi:hypothetical protein